MQFPKSIGTAMSIPLFLLYTEDNWICGQTMSYLSIYMTDPAFISFYFYLDLLNNLKHTISFIRIPQFLCEQKYCDWQVILVAQMYPVRLTG